MHAKRVLFSKLCENSKNLQKFSKCFQIVNVLSVFYFGGKVFSCKQSESKKMSNNESVPSEVAPEEKQNVLEPQSPVSSIIVPQSPQPQTQQLPSIEKNEVDNMTKGISQDLSYRGASLVNASGKLVQDFLKGTRQDEFIEKAWKALMSQEHLINNTQSALQTLDSTLNKTYKSSLQTVKDKLELCKKNKDDLISIRDDLAKEFRLKLKYKTDDKK